MAVDAHSPSSSCPAATVAAACSRSCCSRRSLTAKIQVREEEKNMRMPRPELFCSSWTHFGGMKMSRAVLPMLLVHWASSAI